MRALLVMLVVVGAGLAGCGARHRPSEVSAPERKPEKKLPVGTRAIAHAEAFESGGLPKDARRDCSGFVMAAYDAAGAPLEVPEKYRARHPNASAMLEDWAQSENKAFTDHKPRPGDLVFFRDTTGPLLGKVTHVALVESVDGDGEVTLLHYVNGGVRHDRMDPAHPEDRARNSYLRRTRRRGEPALAGELFVTYARFE